MAEISFKPNYGYRPPSPFWTLLVEGALVADGQQFPSREDAEAEAAVIAQEKPGKRVFVMGVVSAVQTSPEIVGERFDPTKSPPRDEVLPDPAPTPEIPASLPADEQEPI